MRKAKILVIRGGAIGDFILTLPAINALRRQFPDAHLELLGYPHIAHLALAGGLVDRVQPIEARGLAGFFARHGQLAPDLVDYFSEFDLVVSYLFDPDEIFQTNVSRCLHGQLIVGPHRPDETEKIHATRIYLKPLERLAIFDADAVPRLRLRKASLPASGEASSFAADAGCVGTRRLEACATLALHPGSGSEKKNWPEAKWAKLVQHLFDSTELNLLLVGGEAEGERLERLAPKAGSGLGVGTPATRIELAQSLPLPELAMRLQSCVGFVGHDSGISHLAAAVGLPCLVLWAAAAEEIWRPQGERLVLIRASSGVQAISVDAVLRALTDLLRACTSAE